MNMPIIVQENVRPPPKSIPIASLDKKINIKPWSHFRVNKVN